MVQCNLELQMWCQRYLWTCLSWGKASCPVMWPLQDASFCFLLVGLEGTDPGREVLLWGHPAVGSSGGQGTLCSVALTASTLLIPRGIPSCRVKCTVNAWHIARLWLQWDKDHVPCSAAQHFFEVVSSGDDSSLLSRQWAAPLIFLRAPALMPRKLHSSNGL